MRAGRTEIDERYHSSLFQMSEATDENHLDFALFFMQGHTLTRKKKIDVIVTAHSVE